MVVGQTPIVFSGVTAPVHFSTQMCSLPASAQGYQTGATINSSTATPTTPPIPCNLSPLTSPNSPALSPMCNQFNGTIFAYNPTNSYTSIPVIPAVAISGKPDDTPVSPPVQYNPTIYLPPCTQTMLPPNIFPIQNITNGTVIQCTPGLCQYSENIPLCPVPSTVAYANNNHLYIPPSMSIAQTICSSNVVSPWKQSYGMEQVWRKEFDTLFYNYAGHSQHSWTLLPVNERPGGVWYENVDSAKVRFCCNTCGNAWTSMKGRVAFWFILNYASREGVVCLKLYGQQCDRCKQGRFEPAMWYPEEVVKVMINIYHKVGQVYYGFKEAPYHKSRRPGKPRTPHNANLCQACQDGVCAERR